MFISGGLYSTARTDQHGPQEQFFLKQLLTQQQNFDQVMTWRLTTFSHYFSVTISGLIPLSVWGILRSFITPARTTTYKYDVDREMRRLPSKSPVDGRTHQRFVFFPHNRGMLRRSRCVLIFLLTHLNVLTFFPTDWGMLRRSRRVLIFLLKPYSQCSLTPKPFDCSGGLAAFRFFLNTTATAAVAKP